MIDIHHTVQQVLKSESELNAFARLETACRKAVNEGLDHRRLVFVVFALGWFMNFQIHGKPGRSRVLYERVNRTFLRLIRPEPISAKVIELFDQDPIF